MNHPRRLSVFGREIWFGLYQSGKNLSELSRLRDGSFFERGEDAFENPFAVVAAEERFGGAPKIQQRVMRDSRLRCDG
jgi:hypothetical protein